MTATAVPERDLEVLRSFARRIDPSDAGAHNNLGVLYFRRGLAPEAVQSFVRALELDPKMSVAQRNLEIVYRHNGFYDRRIAELRERLRRRSDDREAHWELGRAYASVGQLEEASAEFEAMIGADPADLGALLQLALVEQRRGRLDRALEWLQQAREREPDSSVVEFHRGEVLYHQGMNEDSRAALERAVALNPDNADAWHLLAFVLGDGGLKDEARAASRKAKELNPSLARAQTNLSLEPAAASGPPPAVAGPEAKEAAQLAEAQTGAHVNLARAFRQKGYYNEALREYRLALDRGEDRFAVRQGMAELHLLRRDLPPALGLYDELVAEQPEAAKLWNERGVVLHQLGRGDEARESYGRAIAADPTYALSYNNLGVALASRGEPDDAVSAFRDALRRRPDLLQARLNLALLLAQLHRFQLALEAYRQALESVPDSATAWNGVGVVLAELKQPSDARSAFARAIESDPNYAAAHYNLSFTLSHLGDFDGALREVRRALELDPYYAPQRFLLSVELVADDPELSVIPDLSGERPFEGSGETFVFDHRLLDDIFKELKPQAPAASRPGSGEDAFAMARDCLSKGLIERAIAEVTRAMSRGADRADGAALLGTIYARRGVHGEALERFREARTLVPAHRAARAGEVRALIQLGRHGEARPLAEVLLTGAPDDVDAALLVAESRAATGDAAGAVEVLRKAQERAPGRADVHRLMGDVAQTVGDMELARQAYVAALELDPGYAEVWLAAGRLAWTRGDGTQAERCYRTALERLPTFAEAAHALAALLSTQERHGHALDVLVTSLDRDPYDFDALVLLAQVLLDLDRPADAAAASERVVRFQPDNAAAHYHLGIALARERRYREAVQHWEKCITLEPSGPYAAKAISHSRTASDLVHIFAGEAA
ncbi:MAG: tetratricopeptide repeat protein [Gemmatimonadales bacterium]